jgi:hypothetical protein
MCDELVSRLNCLPRAIGWTTRRSAARVVPTEFDFRTGTQIRDSGRRLAVRGIHRLGYDLQLTQYAERGWRPRIGAMSSKARPRREQYIRP